MRKLFKRSAILGCLLAFNANASMPNDTVDVEKAGEDIETLTVVGERPVLYFKQLARQEEEKFYELYNALTKEEDFKVVCGFDRAGITASIAVKKTCQPYYVKRLRRSLIDRTLAYTGNSESGHNMSFIITQKDELTIKPEIYRLAKLQMAHVEKLLEENPDLLKQLSKYSDSMALYKQKHEEYFKDHWSTKVEKWLGK